MIRGWLWRFSSWKDQVVASATSGHAVINKPVTTIAMSRRVAITSAEPVSSEKLCFGCPQSQMAGACVFVLLTADSEIPQTSLHLAF